MPLEPLLTLNQGLEVGERMIADLPLGFQGAPTPRGSTDDQPPILEWIRKELASRDSDMAAFREPARLAYRFVAGDQYDSETRRILRIEKRPDTAFNSTQKFLRFVGGLQRKSPQALLFEPQVIEDPGDQALSEFTSNVVEWAIKRCGGDKERARAFEDMLTCGVGATAGFIDKQKDPRGLIELVRVSPFEMIWPDCAEENMRSTRWRARESLVDKDEALRRWPKKKTFILAALSGKESGTFPEKSPIQYTVPYIETEPIEKNNSMPKKTGKVCVTEFQWFDDEDGYIILDPVTKEPVWLSDDDYRTYKNRVRLMSGDKVQVDGEKATHRVCKVAFLLNRKHMLAEPKRLPGDRFTLNFITGHFDEDTRQWYGFIRLLMDPQRYANKFFNQLIEILGVSAKGGWLAESDAFETDAQRHDMENNHSKPGAIDLVAPGALKEGKLQAKKVPEIPPGTMGMLQWCVSAMEQVTGISAATIGLGDGQGGGAATTMRQQQSIAMVILASEFDSLERYRAEDEGRMLVALLGLIADDRLIKVGGPISPQVVRLFRQPFMLDYDIMVDDTEIDPNQRQKFADFLLQSLPALTRQGLFVPSMLNYIPFIPLKVRQDIVQAMQAQQQAQEQAARQGINLRGRGAARDPRETEARIADIQSKALLHRAKAQALLQNSRREDLRTILERLKSGEEHSIERNRQTLEQQHLHLNAEQLRLEREKAQAKTFTDLIGHRVKASQQQRKASQE